MNIFDVYVHFWIRVVHKSSLLYVPRILLQLGQLCWTSFKLSMQKGIKQQPHQNTRHTPPTTAHVISPLSVAVLDVMFCWQFGQVICTGVGGNLGLAATGIIWGPVPAGGEVG